MRAWIVDEPRPAADGPLRLVERPAPEPGPGEVRIVVHTCGVCRTDLHLAEDAFLNNGIEGRDMFLGNADVAVCDGFTGNVVLKLAEALTESIFLSLNP